MATGGRKKGGKKSTKWTSVSVETFIDANVKKPSTNWADEVEEDNPVELISHVPHRNVVLPTAPRASRASDFDESKIPHVGPFQIHVSNVPYELEEEELIEFFGDLSVKQARLPKEEGKKKGYGYVEFHDRASLIAALTKPDTVIKNRPIKIELSMADQRRPRMDGRGNRDGGMRGGDMGGPDRTAGNWRSGPRDDYDPPPMERGGGFRGGGGRDFSSGSGGFRGGYDREGGGGGGFGRDREGGFGRDREGGGFRDDRGSFDRERGDNGYSRDDRGRRDDYGRSFGGGRDDRGGGFNRDNRGGFRERDDDRREERGGGGGSWRDFNKSEDRRDRGGYGPPMSRRDDGPLMSRRDDGPPMSRRDDGPPMSRRDDGPPMSRRDDGPPMSRRDDGPPMSRRDDGPPMSRRDDGPPMMRRDDGPPMQERAPLTERKKLNLQPRSAGLPASDKPIVPSAAPSSAIFGGAKPVDTTAREREVEERLNRGDEMPERTRSGPGSTTSSKDYHEEREKPVEVASPPKENPWHKKSTGPPVNNGRTTPDGPSGDERGEGQRSWQRSEPRRQENRHTDDQRDRNRPPTKSGPPSSGHDKGRQRDERPNKSREPRKDHNVDDHKMPKMVENKPPNFVDSNKYNALEDEDEAEE